MQAPPQGILASSPAPAALHQSPTYLDGFFDMVGKIGEGTYGVVYLARSREAHPRLLAIKTFKPGKVSFGPESTA
jgi:serine/threonine protein kinase